MSYRGSEPSALEAPPSSPVQWSARRWGETDWQHQAPDGMGGQTAIHAQCAYTARNRWAVLLSCEPGELELSETSKVAKSEQTE